MPTAHRSRPSSPGRKPARLAAMIAVAGTALTALSALPASATPSNPAEHPCVRTIPEGTSTIAVPFQGESYDVLVTVPPAAAARPLPLVLDLHGSNNNAARQAEISGLQNAAEAKGFIVAEPAGDIAFPQTLPGGNWAWNVPGVPLTSGTLPPEGSRDDVAFLRQVVDRIDNLGCVDDRRVYATGYSGGGRMASALACEASDVFAAIAPVAGLRAGRADVTDLTSPEALTCQPEQPVAVMTFHGTADAVNPYLGNTDPRWGYTVEQAAERWAELNTCRVGPALGSYSASVTSYTWTECDGKADVVLYEIAGGGHTWPGTAVDLAAFGLGPVTQEIDASTAMLDFFADHHRRG